MFSVPYLSDIYLAYVAKNKYKNKDVSVGYRNTKNIYMSDIYLASVAKRFEA